MLKKTTVESALKASQDKLATIDRDLAAAQASVSRLTEARLVTLGQVDALTHVLSKEKPNA